MLGNSEYVKIAGHCILPQVETGKLLVFTNRVGRRFSKDDGTSIVVIDGHKLLLPDYKLKAVEVPENV